MGKKDLKQITSEYMKITLQTVMTARMEGNTCPKIIDSDLADIRFAYDYARHVAELMCHADEDQETESSVFKNEYDCQNKKIQENDIEILLLRRLFTSRYIIVSSGDEKISVIEMVDRYFKDNNLEWINVGCANLYNALYKVIKNNGDIDEYLKNEEDFHLKFQFYITNITQYGILVDSKLNYIEEDLKKQVYHLLFDYHLFFIQRKIRIMTEIMKDIDILDDKSTKEVLEVFMKLKEEEYIVTKKLRSIKI